MVSLVLLESCGLSDHEIVSLYEYTALRDFGWPITYATA